ncbi:L-aspartate oxidase [Gracilimonas mengyeensis]|uniref:L-aspartate oxidase n=1 Tax=Gracilimonas mengyeensis TaxID=1302730 RepID=A0A521AZ20_9BACT|nr:L-aspartate oxidase [Gracilimonas mengyeensis]SMO40011.1 L-aspartate oxidase [Gracilimonas mengyeensis]
MQNKYKYDFLVIGSGLAGLTFALKAAEHGSVAIITKKEMMEANTAYAQGGIAGVLTKHDSFEKHIADTLEAGAGLCNREAVELVVKEGPRLINELIDHGVQFTKKNGKLDLGREGGHSENRIVHAADATGFEVESVMVRKVKNHPNIEIHEHHFVMELLTEHHLGEKVKKLDQIHCFGAYVLDEKADEVRRILAKVTVLAAGGAGMVYQHTTNPPVATGDGIAMAYRAKAKIENMEFVQFHPTSLAIPEAGSFLISEAVRGFGGILRNADGVAFMEQYDERKELAPRDIVARAIDDQLKKRGEDHVFLDVTHLDAEAVKEEFPTIYETCLEYGLDITEDQIPVVPATHYTCGGVSTNLKGETSIAQLYACGEVACTGLHGANRLASNSLLESLVFADRAVDTAIQEIGKLRLNEVIPEWDESGTENTEEWVLVSHNREELRRVMSDYVGIVRSNLRLERAMRRVELLNDEVEDFYDRTRVSVPLCELRNLICVGYLIIRSALQRKESRGLHYTTDYTELADKVVSTVIG